MFTMAFDNHQFCWFGVHSTSVDKALGFYQEVIGYQVQTVPMGEGTSTMLAGGDAIPRAHVMAPPTPGAPSHWHAYLRVVDVDATAALVTANGGTVMVPPTDIPVGRMSVVSTPSGAVFSLFHEADEAGSKNPGRAVGDIHWTELQSTDVQADLAFMKAVFGYEIGEIPMPNDMTYYLFNLPGEEGKMAGGLMAAMMPEMPSVWMNWVEVEDVDAVVAKAKQGGGTVFGEPMDMPGTGRMVAMADPTGSAFGVIAPE